jgi:hypothetical protein
MPIDQWVSGCIQEGGRPSGFGTHYNFDENMNVVSTQLVALCRIGSQVYWNNTDIDGVPLGVISPVHLLTPARSFRDDLALAVRPAGSALDLRVPLTLGGRPGQCAAGRPCRCDIVTALGAPRDTVGTAGGRSPRVPCAAARRAWWASAQRARRKAAAPQRRVPQVEPGRLRRVTLAAHSLSAARARSHCSRPGPSAWRAEGAPLKLHRKL